jgi:tetratricopeptide (TPR) repeat protein
VANRLAGLLALSIFLIVPIVSYAGTFDDPKNLEVLPKDISPDELRETMKGISQGLGARCSTCHVGKIEADLSTYDFSVDDKESKLKARKMLAMVREINEHIADAFADASEPLVSVSCATCHRGQTKPVMLEDALAETLRNDGLEETIANYRQLREQYYGGYTFDFSEGVLMRFAENLAVASDLESALGIIDLNLEFYPNSSRSYVLRAQVLVEKGDTTSARKDYIEALSIEPDSAWIKQQLEMLDAG